MPRAGPATIGTESIQVEEMNDIWVIHTYMHYTLFHSFSIFIEHLLLMARTVGAKYTHTFLAFFTSGRPAPEIEKPREWVIS